MDDVHAAMRVVQGSTDLDADVRHLIGREPRPGRIASLERGGARVAPLERGCGHDLLARAQQFGEARSLDELHREEVRSELDPELVHRDDVRVRQVDGGLGLEDEPADEVVVARELVADLLHDELLLEAAGAAQSRQDYAGHPPASQLALEHVFAKHLRVHWAVPEPFIE